MQSGAALAVFVIVIVIVALARAPFSRGIWNAVTPVLEVRTGAASAWGAFFGQFASNAGLVAENQSLKEELAQAQTALLDRNALLKENLELKAQFGRFPTSTPLLAAVLMSPPGAPYDTLVVDAGAKDGVATGDLVSPGGSVYIGKISDVSDHSSRVNLFSSPGQTFDAWLNVTTPVSIIGQGGGSFSGQIPIGTAVTIGDPVELPSITPQYVARVTAISHREGDSFQSIYLSLPVSPSSLRYVGIYTRHANP